MRPEEIEVVMHVHGEPVCPHWAYVLANNGKYPWIDEMIELYVTARIMGDAVAARTLWEQIDQQVHETVSNEKPRREYAA